MARQFQGRDITKTTLNFGIAGTLELDGNEMPTLSIVEFTAKAKVGNMHYKVKDDGSVQEGIVLTILPDTFDILSIKKAAEQPQLPLTTGPKLPAVEPQEKVVRPLLEACEACGHGKGEHLGGETACRVPACPCQTYTPFPGNQGTVTAEETDDVAADMGLQGPLLAPCDGLHGPLLVACAGCGHPKGNHKEAANCDFPGKCLEEGCACPMYLCEEDIEKADAALAEMDHEIAVGAAGLAEPESAPADDQIATGAVNAKPEPAERPRRRGRGKLRAVGGR